MADRRIIITGEKESFLVRVLLKKIKDTGVDCVFSRWDINEINSRWEGTFLVTVFMDREERPGKDVLHFLHDKLEEEGNRMIVIGEPEDIKYVCDNVSKDQIYKTFIRPMDNNEFMDAVTGIINKMESGDFIDFTDVKK